MVIRYCFPSVVGLCSYSKKATRIAYNRRINFMTKQKNVTTPKRKINGISFYQIKDDCLAQKKILLKGGRNRRDSRFVRTCEMRLSLSVQAATKWRLCGIRCNLSMCIWRIRVSQNG